MDQVQKNSILINLIREQLIVRQRQVRKPKQTNQDDTSVNSGLLQMLIEKDLPIYEDDLKRILFDQSKDHIGKVICQVEYDQKVKNTLQKKQETKSSRQNRKSILTTSPKPIQQNKGQPLIQELQQNLVTLFHNFTQIVSLQVTKNVEAGLRAGGVSKTKQLTMRVKKSVVDNLGAGDITKTKKFNKQPDFGNMVVDEHQKQTNRPDTPGFSKPQNLIEEQKSNKDLEEGIIQEDDFLDDSTPNLTMQLNRSKQPSSFHRSVGQNKSKNSEDQDYPDDFLEDSAPFSQQQSNFFNRKQQLQKTIQESNDQLDFSVEVEDLMI